MVERDRFEKQFGVGWLSVYRYAREGQVSLGEIADKVISSLARTLRDGGGIPAFDDIARIVTQGRELGVLAAFGDLDDLAELPPAHQDRDRVRRWRGDDRGPGHQPGPRGCHR